MNFSTWKSLPFCLNGDDIFRDAERTYIDQRPYIRESLHFVDTMLHEEAPTNEESTHHFLM